MYIAIIQREILEGANFRLIDVDRIHFCKFKFCTHPVHAPQVAYCLGGCLTFS